MTIVYESETINCLICDSHKYEGVLRAQDLMTFTGASFDVVKCSECGFQWTNPRPVKSDICKFYPETYTPYELDKAQISYGPRKRSSLRHFLVSGYYIPKDEYKNKHVLELGCSSGSFLKQIMEKGAVVQGIEFSDYASDIARKRGLPVFTGTLLDFNVTKKFDYVFAWMVLEHLYSPKEALLKIRDMLKDDGLFVFSVPDIGSLDFKIFRKYWHGLHLPGHLSHFDQKTIRKLLEESGFRIVLITQQINSTNYIYSLKLLLNCNGFRFLDLALEGLINKKWGRPIRRLMDIFVKIIGQSGRMTIWAEKV